jgi:hypothetical protein
MYGADVCPPWSFRGNQHKALNCLPVTSRGHFHGAVGGIANPTGKRESVGLLADKPAEPDALDPAFNPEMNHGHGLKS